MNKIETRKQERDGLDGGCHRRRIENGWEAISEADVQRLKRYALFLCNLMPGFFMIRVRIPGGNTGSYQ